MATWVCDGKSLEKSEGCRPEKRAASVRECFVVATIKKSREPVHMRSRRRRTVMCRVIHVGKVPVGLAPLPCTRPQIGVEAMTLWGRSRGVQTTLQTRSSVVLRRESPCEPKTSGGGSHDARSRRG